MIKEGLVFFDGLMWDTNRNLEVIKDNLVQLTEFNNPQYRIRIPEEAVWMVVTSAPEEIKNLASKHNFVILKSKDLYKLLCLDCMHIVHIEAVCNAELMFPTAEEPELIHSDVFLSCLCCDYKLPEDAKPGITVLMRKETKKQNVNVGETNKTNYNPTSKPSNN